MIRKPLLVGILLTCVASIALAAGALTANWTNATTNTDGTAIPATGAGSLAKSIVEYGPCNATKDTVMPPLSTVEVAGTILTATTPANLAPGTWCAHVRHENTYGSLSDWSDVASKVVVAPKPNKPTGFTFG